MLLELQAGTHLLSLLLQMAEAALQVKIEQAGAILGQAVSAVAKA